MEKIHNFYKNKYILEKRKEISNTVLKNHKDIYPIIIQSENKEDYKNEYYAYKLSGNLNLISISKSIIKNEELKKDQSIHFSIFNGQFIIVNSIDKIKILYDKYKDEDGFLYVYYSFTNAFCFINFN